MKKMRVIILMCCFLVFFCNGCGTTKETEQTSSTSSYESVDEDEDYTSSYQPMDKDKVSGLWISDSQDRDGKNYGFYFMDGRVLLIGWVDKKGEDDYFIKGNPYDYSIEADGVYLTAGSGYGSAIKDSEEREGIPFLEYDGELINAYGGEIDGMVFSYCNDTCDYTVDN